MRVLLAKPYNLTDHIQPSLGLGYLATAIRSRHEVRILDCIKEGVSPGKFKEYVEDYQPDVVGLQVYTFDLGSAREILRISRGRVRIVGGPHSSAIPEETMEWFGDDLDFAFRGEAEIGLPIFLDRLSKEENLDDVPGLVWRENHKIRVNEPHFEENLDSLGFPAWDLIKPQEYPESQHGAFYKNFPIAPIIITRGCPYSCTFCAGNLVSGRRIRVRSVEHVLSEIRMLYYDYGVREIHVVDDNFTFYRDFAKALLRKLIASGMKISWAVPNGIRADTLDEELLELMKASGLYLVSLGIESGSDRILNLMKKKTTVKKITRNVQKIHQAEIDIAGFFILGFPTETKREIEETIRFSLELDLIRANFFTYLPFPGTESYDYLLKKGELSKVDWERFYFMNAAYVPQGLTRKELKSLQRKAFLRFFLRPKIFYKNIRAIKSFRHLKFLMRRFYHWLIMK